MFNDAFMRGFSGNPLSTFMHKDPSMTRLAFTFVCATSLALLFGCGQTADTGPKASEAAFKGTTPDDKAEVEAILKKEGIEGEIVSLFKGETAYQVMVGNKAEPGKRNTPSPPRSFTIDKNTKKLTKGSI
jgi:hypothetical protein